MGFFPGQSAPSERKIVSKKLASALIEMKPDMGEFVQQTEPETVETVVTKRKTDHRSTIAKTKGRAVKIRPGKMRYHLERNASVAQEIPGEQRSLFRGAQMGDLP